MLVLTNFFKRVGLIDVRVKTVPSMLYRINIDPLMALLLVLLAAYSIVIVNSAVSLNPSFIQAHVVRIAMAFLLMFLIAQVNINFIRILTPWIFLAAIILLIVLIPLGSIKNGARRWLELGVFSIQPSEIIKIILPMFLAWYLSKRQLPIGYFDILVCSISIAIPFYLVVRQPDLGTAMMLGMIGVTVMFLAGLPRLIIGLGFTATAAAVPIIWKYFLLDYHKSRIITFLDPASDPLGAGWNITQSIIAIGSGGFSGKGYLNGTQAQLEFLPESHTDFIFPVIAEEFGFLGVLLLFMLYAAIIIRGIKMATMTRNIYNRLVITSYIFTLFLYIFVNVGMVSAMLPIVGVPLPFISFGGTSMVTLMVGMGVLMSANSQKYLLE